MSNEGKFNDICISPHVCTLFAGHFCVRVNSYFYIVFKEHHVLYSCAPLYLLLLFG